MSRFRLPSSGRRRLLLKVPNKYLVWELYLMKFTKMSQIGPVRNLLEWKILFDWKSFQRSLTNEPSRKPDLLALGMDELIESLSTDVLKPRTTTGSHVLVFRAFLTPPLPHELMSWKSSQFFKAFTTWHFQWNVDRALQRREYRTYPCRSSVFCETVQGLSGNFLILPSWCGYSVRTTFPPWHNHSFYRWFLFYSRYHTREELLPGIF